MIARYLDEVLPHRYQPKGRQNRRNQLAYWTGALGELRLADLTPEAVMDSRAGLEAGKGPGGKAVSPATSNRYLAALSHVFTVAQREWGWLPYHPIRGRVDRRRESGGRVRYLSEDERKALLEACAAEGHVYLESLVVVAICTGARQGELVAARWRHVDLGRQVWEIPESKSGRPRVVPLAPPTVAALRSLPRGIGEADEVFPGPLPRAAWERAREAADLADVRFHDLRHTAASYLAMSGASVRDIQEILGHRTLAMAQRYAHLSVSHLSEAANRMASRWMT